MEGGGTYAVAGVIVGGEKMVLTVLQVWCGVISVLCVLCMGRKNTNIFVDPSF